MINIKRPSKALPSVLAVFAVVYGGSAIADDGKNYSASFCVQRNSATPSVLYGIRSRAENPSTSSIDLVCPALSDTGERVASGSIVVEDNHPTLSVDCRMETVASDGGAVAASELVSSGGIFTGVRTLPFPGLSSGASLGSHIIRCNVPGASGSNRSAVLTYQVVERE